MISILIPTRDRLDLLKVAIRSVLAQTSPDWEAVVADNASASPVGDYIASLKDERIKLLRSDIPSPVTENWNRAFEGAAGSYLLMLGDDDCLLPETVHRLEELIEIHDQPEMLYSGALLFTYPNVLPEEPQGSLRDYSYASFLQGRDEPFILPKEVARSVVRSAMGMRVEYGFNMQFATLSRSLCERLTSKGPLFQTPFPDYYAMNAAMLEARSILAVPEPLVVIGIASRSYGAFHFTDREEEGSNFLLNQPGSAEEQRMRSVILPGSTLLTNWLYALDRVAANFGGGTERVDTRRYRNLQLVDILEAILTGEVDREASRSIFARLNVFERALMRLALVALRAVAPLRPTAPIALVRVIKSKMKPTPDWEGRKIGDSFSDPLEALDALNR